MDDNKKTFEMEMLIESRSKNLMSGIIFFVYIFFTSKIYTYMTMQEGIVFCATIMAIACFFQFAIAPKTNRLLLKDISDLIERNSESPLSIQDRTILVRDLMNCPILVAIKVGVVVCLAELIPIISLVVRFHVSRPCFIYVLVMCIIGIYNSTIQAFSYAEQIASKHSIALIEQGIDSDIVEHDRHYGISLRARVICMGIIPYILFSISILFYCWMRYDSQVSREELVQSIIIILIINTTLTSSIASYVQRSVFVTTKKINNLLEQLGDYKKKKLYLPTDLNGELAYNIFLIDKLIANLSEISNDAAQTGEKIAESTNVLSVTAKKTADTSVLEATAIRECLATMENTKFQHDTISKNIAKIQKFAEITTSNANIGFQTLEQGIKKMSEIADANFETIYGIKTLSEKVENIWRIITAIETITERTRTVAFNAELEASVAGESGEKFHIVANEIRRLASNITELTTDIKRKIINIQHSSDNLIITSEAGTQKTREGSEFYTQLEENFKEFCLSSDVTTESIKRITEVTDVQKNAFSQINDTLREINERFEQFSLSSQQLSSSAEKLRESAIDMGYTIEFQGGKK